MAAAPHGADPSSNAHTKSETSDDASLLAGAWQGLEADLQGERGVAGTLRGLPSGGRIAIVVIAALAFPSLVLALAPRADMHEVSTLHAVLWSSVLAGLAGAGAWIATRSLQARSLEPTRVLSVALVMIAAAVLLVLLPLGAGGSPDPAPHGPFGCIVLSLVVGTVTFAIVRVLRRDAIGASVGAGIVAATAALATAALACPMDALVHLAPGHLAPVVVIAMIGLLIDRRRPANA